MSAVNLKVSAGRVHSQRAKSLPQQLAEAWGDRTPRGVSQTLYNRVDGLPAKMEKLLFDLRRFGAKTLAFKIVRRFDAVLREEDHAPVTPLRLAEHEAVDSHENIMRARYVVTGDPKHRAELIRALDQEIVEKTAIRDALCAEEKGD